MMDGRDVLGHDFFQLSHANDRPRALVGLGRKKEEEKERDNNNKKNTSRDKGHLLPTKPKPKPNSIKNTHTKRSHSRFLVPGMLLAGLRAYYLGIRCPGARLSSQGVVVSQSTHVSHPSIRYRGRRCVVMAVDNAG